MTYYRGNEPSINFVISLSFLRQNFTYIGLAPRLNENRNRLETKEMVVSIQWEESVKNNSDLPK